MLIASFDRHDSVVIGLLSIEQSSHCIFIDPNFPDQPSFFQMYSYSKCCYFDVHTDLCIKNWTLSGVLLVAGEFVVHLLGLTVGLTLRDHDCNSYLLRFNWNSILRNFINYSFIFVIDYIKR